MMIGRNNENCENPLLLLSLRCNVTTTKVRSFNNAAELRTNVLRRLNYLSRSIV